MVLNAIVAIGLLYQQHKATSRSNFTPPAEPPTSCSITELANLAAVTGSESYRALRFELEAMTKAEEAAHLLDKMNDRLSESPDVSSAMGQLISETENARDHILCASYILGKWKPSDKKLQMASEIMISTYNRRANQIETILENTKRIFASSSRPTTGAAKLRAAEKHAAMTEEQRKITQDFLDVVTYSLMLSIDLSDPAASTTEYLKLSCREREDILERSENLKGPTEDDFVSAAKVMHEVMSSHKCH